MKRGRVCLVGAGPGIRSLIAVKGLERLRKADVIVYDRLVDDSLLEEAPAEAEKIYVGKGRGCHAMEQKEINLLMVTKAREGKTVVRLKGGDPFVLGRGGEEAEVLAANHIPFEIVPGVSSAYAVPAYAGIPVTHRHLASSFTVITGHEAPVKGESSIVWDKISTGSDTLVFTATYASWMNRIECHFAPFRRFVLDNSDWSSHTEIARAAQDYLRWRNRDKKNARILKEQNTIRTL